MKVIFRQFAINLPTHTWTSFNNAHQAQLASCYSDTVLKRRFYHQDIKVKNHCLWASSTTSMHIGVERNRKARILVCSETYWMSSGCHILMFNWSFFSAEIFHWRYFVCFCSFARLHFRKFCIIWNRCREDASQYRHHLNFSPTSIHWIQKCERLLHEFEYQIMLSVSVFVSWNSSRKWNHYLNGYTVLLTVSAIKTRHY